MSLGIDVYRYQHITDWQAVRAARIRIAPNRDPQPIEWVYRKLTDGLGAAPSRGDEQVAGARAAGFPVGGYHFAQPGDPRTQARLLLAEARRLHALDLPPMLDLEDNPPGSGKPNIPFGQTKTWSLAFLDEISKASFRPCIYLSSSDAKALRPDQWGVTGLVVWIASYGPNNGLRNSLTGGYPGRIDVHQYTSAGRVPGISGAVDLNEAFIDLREDDDMPSVQEIVDAIKTQVLAGDWRFDDNRNPIDMQRATVATGFANADKLNTVLAKLDALGATLGDDEQNLLAALTGARGDILAAVAAIPPSGNPTDEQVEQLATRLKAGLGAEVAEEVGRRLVATPQEGTGPQ
jgi:GH25 family lysozyme M1 (1,4-beta-N-acetylmuramidase)